jgi:LruC domain-containing protein
MVINAQNKLIDAVDRFRLLAAGAGFNNGFAVAFDINPQDVSVVQGGKLAANLINLDPKGFKAGHENQTIGFAKDAINSIYPSETFINTVPGVPYFEAETVTMSMTLLNPQANYGLAPFNPLILFGGERSKVVRKFTCSTRSPHFWIMLPYPTSAMTATLPLRMLITKPHPICPGP